MDNAPNRVIVASFCLMVASFHFEMPDGFYSRPPLEDAALEYAQRDWRVIPLRSRRKAPNIIFLLTDDQGWSRAFLFAPALTIGGGTTEVQRNILAQRVLGLPRET